MKFVPPVSVVWVLLFLFLIPQSVAAFSFGSAASAVVGGLATQDFGFTSSAVPPVPCTCAPLSLPGDFLIFGFSDKFIPKAFVVNMPVQLANPYTYKAHLAPFTQQLGKVSAIPTICWVGVLPYCAPIYVPNGTIQFSGTSVPGASLFR